MLVLLNIAAPVGAADAPAQDEAVGIYRQLRPSVVSIENAEGSGTGILLQEDGLILTNAHVVTSPLPYRVKVDTGVDAKEKTETVIYKKVSIVGYHPHLDLALVKIDPKEQAIKLQPVKLGEKKGEPGQHIFVIGNPAGGGMVLTKSITTGILSGVDREVDGERFYQIDAAVNPGNSGGPVVDASGAVIGLVTFKFTDAEAIAFAIPLNGGVDIKTFVPLAKRKIDAARSKALQDLGEKYATLAEDFGRREGLDSPNRLRLHYYAAVCYRMAVIDAPDNPGVWYSIGMLLRTIDEDDVAVAYLMRSIQIAPWDRERGNPYRELGFSLVKSKQDDKALVAWKEGIAKHPFAAKIWEDMAIFHIQHEQYADAAHDASVAMLIGTDARLNVMADVRNQAMGRLGDGPEKTAARERIQKDSIAVELGDLLATANKGRKARTLYINPPFANLAKEIGGDEIEGAKEAISMDLESWPGDLKGLASLAAGGKKPAPETLPTPPAATDAPAKSVPTRPPLPESESVARARADYEKGLSNYAIKSEAFRKHYLKELDDARAAAEARNDHADAERLAAERDRVASGPNFLTVTRARYGLKGKYIDVTQYVSAAVKNNRLTNVGEAVSKSGQGDPAPGEHKYLLLEGMYGGKPFNMTVMDTALVDIVFGDPAEPEK